MHHLQIIILDVLFSMFKNTNNQITIFVIGLMQLTPVLKTEFFTHQMIFLIYAIQQQSQDYTTCFQQTEILKGDRATQKLYVVIQPKKELSDFCKAIHDRQASINVTIYSIAKDLIPKSDNITLNMSESEITFTIQLADNGSNTSLDIYNNISNQKYASYVITALDNIQLEGSIQTLLFNTLDATNCWASSKLTYDISNTDKFIRVDVEPNDCNISKSVSVKLQWSFKGTNSWHSVAINPTGTTNTSEYNNNTSYNHSSIRTFVQYYKNYNGSNAEQNKKDFDNFIQNFIMNRSLVLKLVVAEEGQTIKQEYYTTLQSWQGSNLQCYTKHYLYQSPTNIAIKVYGRTNCSIINQGNKMNVTIVVMNSDGRHYQQTGKIDNNVFEIVTVLRFDLENTWPVNTSEMSYGIYLTLYNETGNNIDLVTEMTYFGKATKTCFRQVNVVLTSKEICLDIYLIQIVNGTDVYDNNVAAGDDLKCLERFNSLTKDQTITTYWDDEYFVVTGRHYTTYTTFKPQKFSSFHQSLCFKETNPPVKKLVDGNLEKRSLLQVAKIFELGKKQATGLYMNDDAAFYTNNVIYKASILMYIWAFVPGVVALSGIGLFLYIQYKQNK